ncbi:MAG: alpha/beta hydrolase [Solobacterium sp.]|nr:alpha/beta hydrolase [Solobacterium sp.]
MFVNHNGIQIYYEVKGNGRPLILLHGNGEDHTIFDESAEVLAQQYTCYLVDSRGHGQSTSVAELHYQDMADDMIAFMEKLDLNDVAFYGFSDGGIIGLLASMRCDRITDLITSGANMTPNGVKPWLKRFIQGMYFLTKDPKMRLMLEEPHITRDELQNIRARTLILAGSNDAVKEKETLQIAEGVPNATLRIIDGETHGSYIVHSRKIADLLAGWLSQK